MKNEFLPRDYKQKIDGTFVTYRNVVYWARLISDNELALFRPSKSYSGENQVVVLRPNDENLDLDSVRLGYFNNPDQKAAIYIIRNPVRKVKQGVSTENIAVYALTQDALIPVTNNHIHHAATADGWDNKYPSLTKTLAMLETSWHSVAMSPDVGLSRSKEGGTYNVFFKRQHVGTYNKRTNVVTIPNSTFSVLLSHFVGQHGWIVQ